MSWWRDMTAAWRLAAGLVVLGAVILLGLVIAGWIDDATDWLPGSEERRLEQAETRAGYAEADADARGLDVELRDQQTEAVAASDAIITQARRATERATVQAEEAFDSHVEIDPDRDARIRDLDRRLCDIAPAQCAAAAAQPGRAAAGAKGLSAADRARWSADHLGGSGDRLSGAGPGADQVRPGARAGGRGAPGRARGGAGLAGGAGR